MTFEELISGLGSKIGVELTSDDGSCVINVDDMVVTLMSLPDSDRLAVYGEIGDPPPEGLEQLLSAMLEANHLFAGTAGATISRDHETGRFHLCRQEPLAILNADTLAAILQSFVNTLEIWRRAIADYRPPAEGGTPRPAEPEPDLGLDGLMRV
jgi:hypothetical protein